MWSPGMHSTFSTYQQIQAVCEQPKPFQWMANPGSSHMVLTATACTTRCVAAMGKPVLTLRQSAVWQRVTYFEGAAAHGVCLIVVLLMASSQGQLVDEVEGAAHLLPLHILAVPVRLVHLANVIHMMLHPHTMFGSSHWLCDGHWQKGLVRILPPAQAFVWVIAQQSCSVASCTVELDDRLANGNVSVPERCNTAAHLLCMLRLWLRPVKLLCKAPTAKRQDTDQHHLCAGMACTATSNHAEQQHAETHYKQAEDKQLTSSIPQAKAQPQICLPWIACLSNTGRLC